MQVILAFCLVAVVAIVVPAPAHAYLDPGSASMIVQMIIGAVAGVGIAVKLYWHKIKGVFDRDTRHKVDSDAGANPPD